MISIHMKISIENRYVLKWRHTGFENKTGKTGIALAALS